MYWYSRHLFSIHWGSIGQSSFVCQVWCSWYSRHLFSIHLGGPLAKVGSSAKFGVVVFKASILDSLGGSISQSRFICQVWCTGIQGIYALFIGGGQSRFICQVWCTGIQGSITQGVHWPKYVHLPSLVYWYSRHLFLIHWGSIGQSRFICQFCVLVFKASMLYSLGVHQPK